ncbi:hypothetical protein [Dysosmobacter sp.]|jgi:hypothetical protein|uniref:hypothetical protein n=1 Tax=Dysosmobacter sp. TaxID=2591382 RepID=UPI002A94DB30|nr:hypothetical protein [Dysosmobacter sp.]MDY5509520.1 hypothetical protein [Dysosmobacter sp.]
MYFLIGFLGAVLGGLLFSGGFAVGWKVHTIYVERTNEVVAKELSEAEKRRIQEEQEAFSALQNYSVEQAYGLNRGKDV